jgi:hypothetical protein
MILPVLHDFLFTKTLKPAILASSITAQAARMEEKTLLEPFLRTVIKSFAKRRLRGTSLRCLLYIVRDFFLLQYRAVLFPKRIPVSQSDHPLDGYIPFNPRWVVTYLSFVSYWIRIAGFILACRGEDSVETARRFIESIGNLYEFAAQIYRKNLSTTRRPRYLKRFRFLIIHLFDPHLMCIPSLHVMIAIRGYTAFRAMTAKLEASPLLKETADKLRRQALDITQAVLYVKQHSVNCISAAMYAMSRFEAAQFPPDEAEAFVNSLFCSGGINPGGAEIRKEDIPIVRTHILGLYRSFLKEGKEDDDWRTPLFRFLAALPPAASKNN